MKYIDLYQKLNKHRLYVFRFDDLLRLFSRESPAVLKVQIHSWKKKGWLKTIRRGIYKIVYPEEKVIPDLYVANRLYEPSYVSLETVLSMYSIIPEVAIGVTSITTKPTRRFGAFTYRTVRTKAFTGYRIIKERGFEIRVAEPEKALVDYLYFKLRKKENISQRFEKEILKRLKRKKLQTYAKLYPGKIKEVLKEIYADL
jgi:predicted transcriptional regulator of viral defense system